MRRTARDPVLRWAALVFAALAAVAILSRTALAEEITIRVAVPHLGAAEWELETIRDQGFDGEHGVALEIVPMAGQNAMIGALREREVDMIIADWIWVSRERANGERFAFMPFSKAAGTLVVSPEARIETVGDLRDKRLGVAEGPRDLGWLMIRALALQEHEFDPEEEADLVFGAPALLDQRLVGKMLDAVVTNWRSAAHLQAQGMMQALDVQEAVRRLGVERPVPLQGFVFRDDWAEANQEAVLGLLEASRQAKALLLDSEEAWEPFGDMIRVKDQAAVEAMKESYRAGILTKWGAAERGEAGELLETMAELGIEGLVVENGPLEPGTFWSPARY